MAAGLAGAAALSALLALGVSPSYASAPTGLREEVSLPPIPTTFPPLPDLRAPNIEQAVLPNGLRIFMMEDHEVPLVKASLVMRGGMRASPPDKVLSGPWCIYLCIVSLAGVQTVVAGLPERALRCLPAVLATASSYFHSGDTCVPLWLVQGACCSTPPFAWGSSCVAGHQRPWRGSADGRADP